MEQIDDRPIEKIPNGLTEEKKEKEKDETPAKNLHERHKKERKELRGFKRIRKKMNKTFLLTFVFKQKLPKSSMGRIKTIKNKRKKFKFKSPNWKRNWTKGSDWNWPI